MKTIDKEKVVIAMSGGVDSSVAAALLVEQGYDVTGIMLKLWSSDCNEAQNACCTPESINLAREVASIIDIPFYVIDAKEEFKNQIVNKFVEDNYSGLTPNPCYWCNRSIRWGYLLEKALSMGAEFLATGHYAKINRDAVGKFHLFRGADAKKDQSYVLSGLNQFQLEHTLLPLGEFTKNEIREKACNMNLPVATKHDSQDLCFVGESGYRQFLSQYSKKEKIPGKIVDKTGKVFGFHDGLQGFTIGQRKGLGNGNKEPVYVISKKRDSNEIVIGGVSDLLFDLITITPINWISGEIPDLMHEFTVKIRYKATMQTCRIIKFTSSNLTIKMDLPVRDATPGQIAVLYNGDEVIGSGEIIDMALEGE